MVFSTGCGRRTGRRCCRAVAGRAVSASPFNGNAPRSEALPKQKRLAKRREFLHVYETGRKVFSRYAVLFFAANDLAYSRIGVTATKKLGKANVRNRLKRWSREVYRRERAPLDLDGRAVDVVINVKPNAGETTFADYSRDLARALDRVAELSRTVQ